MLIYPPKWHLPVLLSDWFTVDNENDTLQLCITSCKRGVYEERNFAKPLFLGIEREGRHVLPFTWHIASIRVETQCSRCIEKQHPGIYALTRTKPNTDEQRRTH